MRYFTLTVIFMAVTIACLIGTSFAEISGNNNPNPVKTEEKDVTGNKIPSFKLKNIEGDEILREDYKEKDIVLFFFSTKCPYSINSAKYFNELLKDSKDVEFFAICLDGEIGDAKAGGKTQLEAAKEFSKKYLNDLKNAEILLANDTFRQEYGVFFGMIPLQTAPLHVFVESNSRCETYIKGSTDKEAIKKAIDELSK